MELELRQQNSEISETEVKNTGLNSKITKSKSKGEGKYTYLLVHLAQCHESRAWLSLSGNPL